MRRKLFEKVDIRRRELIWGDILWEFSLYDEEAIMIIKLLLGGNYCEEIAIMRW